MARDRLLFVTAQTRSEVADPTHEELYPVGTLVRVLQLFRLPDGTMRVLVEGLARCRARRFLWSNDYFTVTLALEPEAPPAGGPELEAAQRHVLGQFTRLRAPEPAHPRRGARHRQRHRPTRRP